MEFDRDRGQIHNTIGERTDAEVGLHAVPGHRRLGPRTRERILAQENQRRQWRERQRLSRARRRDADGERNEVPDLRWGLRRNRSSVWRRAKRITASLSQLLERIPGPHYRALVLDKVFSSPRLRRILPEYYPTPKEARAQQAIIQNIRRDLVAMKIPHSSGMLARKRAILEAVVSELDSDITKFDCILGTRKENLVAAVDRLRSAASVSSTRFTVPSRKKREGGICFEVKALVLEWWTVETRVSPQRRDVRRKRLGRNSYDTHAAHLLMESQVLSFW